MKSPVNGGAFYGKKVTTRTNILGYYDKTEYYQDPDKLAPTHSNGINLGFSVKALLGAEVEIERR